MIQSSEEQSSQSEPQASAGNAGPAPSQMPPEFLAAVEAELKGTFLGSLTEDDEDWFFDMDGKA